MSVIEMKNFIGVQESGQDVLGKFLYFSLSSVLIERGTLAQICEDMGLPVSLGARISTVDAFKSATGDLYERIVTKNSGEVTISKVYCRDNQTAGSVYSRELVKETLDESTNHYKKLANLSFDKEYDHFSYSAEGYDADVDAYTLCEKAEELFRLYKDCAGKSQIETLTESFLSHMESLKISVRGRLFFVPKKHMHMVNLFEDFVEALNANNKRGGQLIVNSMFVVDDAKQRGKMTAEFYTATRKEIELYMEKVEHLISSGSQSPAIMERWITKVERLEEKKNHYEEILKQELDQLDDQYDTLRFLASELSARVNAIRVKKAA